MLTHRTHQRLNNLATHLALIGVLVVVLGPFFWLLTTSLKPNEAMFRMPPQWIPAPITLQHYRDVLDFPLMRYLGNTLLIVVFTTAGTVLSSAMAAYACSRLLWPDRKLVFALLIATMMIPPQVTQIPLFTLFTRVHAIDTFIPLIVPAFFGNAFFIFLLRQFFLTIPEELLEAARLDGATEWQVFVRVILPLSKPALITVAIFSILGAWNDFMGPLIYLTSPDNRTLALALTHLLGVQATEWGVLMAAAVLMVAPALLLFFFAQRFFIEGIAFTGTKA